MKKPKEKSEDSSLTQSLEPIFADLEVVESTLHLSLPLRGYFENARISFSEKVKTLKKIFKDYLSSQAYDFIYLLLRSNAISSLTNILRNYKRTREQTGILEFEVKTAVPLSAEEKELLVQRFMIKLGRPLTIRNIVDPNIIGGMVVKAGDIMIDASVSSKMNTLIKQLRQG